MNKAKKLMELTKKELVDKLLLAEYELEIKTREFAEDREQMLQAVQHLKTMIPWS